jgi:hypothetical protein
MRRKWVHTALVVIGVAVLLFGALSRWGPFPVFCVRRDIDINSGDIRTQVCLLGIPTAKTEASAFSCEIRRLRINASETPVWKCINVRTFKGFAVGTYDGAIEDCNFLVQLLSVSKMQDENRARILSKALVNLQTGELDQTHDLIDEVAEHLRATYGLPPTPEEQKLKWNHHNSGFVY